MVGRHDIVFILLLVAHAKSGRNKYNFFPNLPVGEYRWYVKSMATCKLPANDADKLTIHHTLFLNKTSRNTSELRGSIWSDKPFDDSLTIHLNFAVKDSIGGWKDNAFLYTAPEGCSMSKRFLGDAWPLLIKAFGFNNTNCPILPGTYVSKGFDLSNLGTKINAPKAFFYGVYKFRIYFTNENKDVCSCTIFIVEVKRPWEEE